MNEPEILGMLKLHDKTFEALSASGIWISAEDPSLETGRICGLVYADKDGDLYIEQSGDGLSWDVVKEIEVSAGTGKEFSYEKVAQHARVRYVNGDTAQTIFRLYVYRRVRMI